MDGSGTPCRQFSRALVLLLLLAGPASPQEPAEDPYLFKVCLGRAVLSEAFPALPRGNGFLVPFGELCRTLDLAIEVDAARGLASGFLIEEARTFRLDARAGTVSVGGNVRRLDPTRLQAREDDIYVDTRLLPECLPLEAIVLGRESMITLQAKETLPLQARWEREGRARGLGREGGPRVFPPAPDPYRMLEWPALDLALTMQRNGGITTGQGSLLAAGDLLRMSGSVYAMFQQPGGLGAFHGTLGRRDPRGGLLGPLRATEFQAGEVLLPGTGLTAAPEVGTGFLLTNQSLLQGPAFDRQSFKGDLPPGWQVELYQNHGLAAFQASRPDGRYEFLDVPLTYGPNEFRLVFHGPRGQRREERLSFDVGRNQLPAGTFVYHAAGVAPQGGQGGRFQLLASQGLSSRLSVHAGFVRALVDGRPRSLGTGTLQGFWPGFATTLTLAADGGGGSALEASVLGRLGPLRLGGRQLVFRDGFRSPLFTAGIRSRSELEISAPLPDPLNPRLTLDLGLTRDTTAGGGTADSARLRLSTTLAGFFLSNQITRTLTGNPGLRAGMTQGEFLASRIFRTLALRTAASYRLAGARTLETLAFNAETTRFTPLTLEFQSALDVRSQDRRWALSATRAQGVVALGLAAGRSSRQGWMASLTVRLGLQRNPFNGRWQARAGTAALGGAVAARAFLDRNGNRAMDPGETPLPQAAFTLNESLQQTRTGPDGTLFLTGLTEGADAQVAIAPASLEDPLMRPVREGDQVTPRAGHVTRLEVPVVMAGEISGTVTGIREGVRRPLPGVRVELSDAAGRVITSVRTAYDGFYTFGNLEPGSRVLAVSAQAAAKLGAAPPPPRAVELSPEGTSLDAEDFELSLPPPPPGDGRP